MDYMGKGIKNHKVLYHLGKLLTDLCVCVCVCIDEGVDLCADRIVVHVIVYVAVGYNCFCA